MEEREERNEPTKWKKSEAKLLLRNDIIGGRVGVGTLACSSDQNKLYKQRKEKALSVGRVACEPEGFEACELSGLQVDD